ncbi:MAG: hypothetical protein JWP97_3323 [Labilithrix sp.]|nr:hypothetical protein [Labilithrix sp.]
MKRIRGYVLAAVVAGTAGGAALPACSTNDKTIFVQSVLAPSTNRQGGSCVYTADPTQASLSSGALDIGLTGSYLAEILGGNQLIPKGDQLALRAESDRVHVEGGVIRVTEPDGTLIREFTSLTSGFIDVGSNNLPGYGAFGLALIDQETSDIISPQLTDRFQAKTVISTVKLFGRTLGNEDVESGEFSFPIQVCKGCLVSFGAEACKEAPDDALRTLTTNPCRGGQDLSLPCRLCYPLPVCTNAP